MQDYQGNDASDAFILAILHNDSLSEHAKRRDNKERFDFICYHGREVGYPVYALTATHGHSLKDRWTASRHSGTRSNV